MSAVQITTADDGYTIIASGYVLRLRAGEPSAVLSDPGGRTWSRLSLLADVDRTDAADSSYEIGDVQVKEGDGVVRVTVSMRSSAWRAKSVQLTCFDDRVELRVRVEGSGTLGDVRVLGGRAGLASGACGTFRSSIGFASVFVPTPTEPVQVVRPAASAATLGVVGDAAPGRVHGIFSPPPLCLVFGRSPARGATDVPEGDWLAASFVADIAELRFTELRYSPLDGGFLVELDYDGHTTVAGSFVTPPLVLRPVENPWVALRGDAAAPAIRDWWREPIFCGWGAQCARAKGSQVSPPELSRQELYDEWLDRLAAHDVVPGTIVIDDRWQAAYGTAEPDESRWPDLPGWIAARHAAGQHVLLWWKAWDPEGLPADECVCDQSGRPVAADPGSAAYRDRLSRIVTHLVNANGLDADGFKIDFTQRAPAGWALQRPGAPHDAPWGIAALHLLLQTIHRAAKAAKPDALVVTHTPHPGFGDVSDMIRLNDVLERDPSGAVVPAVEQLRFRHAVASAVLPDHLIDTDQWPIRDRAEWREYVVAQAGLGVPALYYAERIDGSGEELTDDDLALVARTWREYREHD